MDLKNSAYLQPLILNGRVFHSFGAIKEKACSPYGSGAVTVVLNQTNVMSFMVYSELKTDRHYHCIFVFKGNCKSNR